MSFETFPIPAEQNANPANKLFGNRFFNDQIPAELLIEFLLVAASPKRIGNGPTLHSALPSLDHLLEWQRGQQLHYAPKARLNLKLFALLGASRLDSRHQTHRAHYEELLEHLSNATSVAGSANKDEVLRTLENLLLGFQGAGSGRTWCAQSFLPVCRGLLAGETIWNETAARGADPPNWEDVRNDVNAYFSRNRHRFLARGGEVLFLQLCAALRQTPPVIKAWADQSGLDLRPRELEPEQLRDDLQKAIEKLLTDCPETLTEIAEFIDSGVEGETARATDRKNGNLRFVDASWCAAESWQEGYLFAVELVRLCNAKLDLIERLSLLEVACTLQLLRTLAVQSARHLDSERWRSWPGYRLAVSAPSETDAAIKRISRQTAKTVERLIFHAVRLDDIAPGPAVDAAKVYKEADRRYGAKLFTGMSKRIGFLIPRRGSGARFTMTDRLLRVLVLTTVPANGLLTYDTFKSLIEVRYGLVFDAGGVRPGQRVGRRSRPRIFGWCHRHLVARHA